MEDWLMEYRSKLGEAAGMGEAAGSEGARLYHRFNNGDSPIG